MHRRLSHEGHGHPNMPMIRAVGSMIGAVVGVGIFGLPYAFAQSGFLIGVIELIFIGLLVFSLQLMFADVVIRTPGKHRLVGLIARYLGPGWGYAVTPVFAASLWGAMLAYMIVGGDFLFNLFGSVFGGPPVAYALAMAVIAALLTYRGVSFLVRLEVFIVGCLLFLFVFMFFASVPNIHPGNLLTVDLAKAWIPYGVILFSVSGLGIIPEMKHILGAKNEHRLPQAIFTAMAVILLMYGLFALAIVGVTGSETTEAAFDGLVPVLGPTFRIAAALLGSIVVSSIFSILAVELQGVLRYDYGFSLHRAWFVTLAVPVALYLLGVREFIGLVGFVGAVFSGLLALFMIAAYERMRRSPACAHRPCLQIPRGVSLALALVFAGGAIIQIVTMFVG